MTRRRQLMTRIGWLPALLALAAPAAASAEYLVPPSNSAATQYTEAYPTAGGNRQTGTGGGRSESPGKALGERNARRLEARGADGRAAASLAAETAPAPIASTATGGGEAGGSGAAAGRRNTGGWGNDTDAAVPGGSSGAGEVLGTATGTSGGQIGLLLPLALIGTLVWALVYLWRRRGRQSA